jgi:hypothetical protein
MCFEGGAETDAGIVGNRLNKKRLDAVQIGERPVEFAVHGDAASQGQVSRIESRQGVANQVRHDPFGLRLEMVGEIPVALCWYGWFV